MTPGNSARQTRKESAMTTQANHLEILSVTAQGQRSVWTRIGTAFPTKDGKGYRLKIDLVPTDSAADILMLPAKEKPSGEEGR
jgi:hypothetical protein